RAESDLLAHSDVPVTDFPRGPRLIESLFETVFDPMADADGELRSDTVLWVGILDHDGLMLRVRYKTDVLDAESAARIADYHLTALSLMTANPDAEHAPASLLSAEEMQFQLHRLAGPPRILPDRRAHELFEERVRERPDAIAAIHGDRYLT